MLCNSAGCMRMFACLWSRPCCKRFMHFSVMVMHSEWLDCIDLKSAEAQSLFVFACRSWTRRLFGLDFRVLGCHYKICCKVNRKFFESCIISLGSIYFFLFCQLQLNKEVENEWKLFFFFLFSLEIVAFSKEVFFSFSSPIQEWAFSWLSCRSSVLFWRNGINRVRNAWALVMNNQFTPDLYKFMTYDH